VAPGFPYKHTLTPLPPHPELFQAAPARLSFYYVFSVSTVKAKNHGRTKAGRRKVDFLGNKAIAENWDRKQTVTQNYKRLGLSSRLNAATGGVEKFKAGKENNGVGVIAINRERREAKIRTEEVMVERDGEGKILRVIRPEGVAREKIPNPLGDLLNDVEEGEEEEDDEDTRDAPSKSNVVAALEQEAADEAERIARKRPRQQSKREEEWLGRLVAKYGQDTRAMARDRKLNPMQQTEPDIQRRLKKWLASK
jgi:nucleolar protein 16